MIINIVLALIFLSSLFFLWYRISLKIPELVAIPDAVITERFYEDSARLRLFVLHIKAYYREGKHKLVFWKFVGKTLYKLHLFLLRFDNAIVLLLRRVKEHGVAINGLSAPAGNGVEADREEQNYWQKVQKEPTPVIPKTSRVVEVRKR